MKSIITNCPEYDYFLGAPNDIYSIRLSHENKLLALMLANRSMILCDLCKNLQSQALKSEDATYSHSFSYEQGIIYWKQKSSINQYKIDSQLALSFIEEAPAMYGYHFNQQLMFSKIWKNFYLNFCYDRRNDELLNRIQPVHMSLLVSCDSKFFYCVHMDFKIIYKIFVQDFSLLLFKKCEEVVRHLRADENLNIMVVCHPLSIDILDLNSAMKLRSFTIPSSSQIMSLFCNSRGFWFQMVNQDPSWIEIGRVNKLEAEVIKFNLKNAPDDDSVVNIWKGSMLITQERNILKSPFILANKLTINSSKVLNSNFILCSHVKLKKEHKKKTLLRFRSLSSSYLSSSSILEDALSKRQTRTTQEDDRSIVVKADSPVKSNEELESKSHKNLFKKD